MSEEHKALTEAIEALLNYSLALDAHERGEESLAKWHEQQGDKKLARSTSRWDQCRAARREEGAG